MFSTTIVSHVYTLPSIKAACGGNLHQLSAGHR